MKYSADLQEIAVLRRIVFAATLLTIGLAAATPALGQTRWEAREIALLPPYCQTNQWVTGDKKNPAAQQWRNLMGKTYEAIHHYCWAQMAINRGKLFSKSKKERLSWLRLSIGDFEYVLRYSPPEFILLPEILTKKGETLIEIGRVGDGVADLQRAIELKPDYWPPYAAMSDFYTANGNRAKAREMLEKALSFSPETRALRNRLAELESPGDRRKSADQPAAKQEKQPREPQEHQQKEKARSEGPLADPALPSGR